MAKKLALSSVVKTLVILIVLGIIAYYVVVTHRDNHLIPYNTDKLAHSRVYKDCMKKDGNTTRCKTVAREKLQGKMS